MYKVLKKQNVCKYIYQCHSSRISGCCAWATRKCTHSHTEKMCTHLSDIGQIMYTQFRNCLYWSALSKCTHSWVNLASHGDVASPPQYIVWWDTILAASFWAARRTNGQYVYIQVPLKKNVSTGVIKTFGDKIPRAGYLLLTRAKLKILVQMSISLFF
jgi:hypothetical protein